MTPAEELRARLDELDRQRRAPMPTVEQTTAWREADLVLAPRLRAICPGVPLHHIHAILTALHSVQHIDGSATCCVCGGGPVTYRNYREQPFCWPCADCQCNENPCVRTGINDPAVSAEAAGYCPHCGRGDAGPTADQYEQQRKRAAQAAAASRESERQLQQQIERQAKEIDRLRDEHRHEQELSADLRARLKATSDAYSEATTVAIEALDTFRFDTHPGRKCKQSDHVPVETIERWRVALQLKEAPDA